MRVKNMKLRKF